MAASRSAEPSALRTGLSQLALSLGAFGALAGLAVGGAMIFGSDDSGGPKVEIALFSQQSGPPPLLKNRLDSLPAEDGGATNPAYDPNAIPDGEGDGEGGDAE